MAVSVTEAGIDFKITTGGAFCSYSILPVARAPMQVGNGDDAQHPGLDLEDHTEGKAVNEAAPSSGILPPDLGKHLLAGNQLDLTSINLGDPPFGFFRPQLVDIRTRRKVETGQNPVNQADPLVGWKIEGFVNDSIGCCWHFNAPICCKSKHKRRRAATCIPARTAIRIMAFGGSGGPALPVQFVWLMESPKVSSRSR
jgi:hypothetical protein